MFSCKWAAKNFRIDINYNTKKVRYNILLIANGEIMSYIPNTDAERNQMLKKIGVHSFEELIQVIPRKFRLQELLNLSPPKL